MQLNILSLLIFFPLLFFFVPGKNVKIIRLSAIAIAVGEFLLSLFILLRFQVGQNTFQMIEEYRWMPGIAITFGIDGTAIALIVLSTLLTFFCIIYNRDIVENELKKYFSLFFLLESAVIGLFCSLNLLVFYIFFEISLIPIFLIIIFWGGKEKTYAALKMIMYTVFGSLFMLAAIAYIYTQYETLSFIFLPTSISGMDLYIQKWLWIAFFLAFAIKIPLFPFHSWLPEAHVQAPTTGSMFLAGVLLKLGTFGMLRVLLGLFPEVSQYFSKSLFILSIISIFYASLAAMAQTDIKKVIAYSSIAHMGFVVIGLFSGSESGIHGAIFQMISHGLISAALFLCIGIIYTQSKTLEIENYGGLIEKIPKFGAFFLFLCMASVGLPATSGFVGEFLVLMASSFSSWNYTIILAISIVFSAIYMLNLYKNMMLGAAKTNQFEIVDLKCLEFSILMILAFLIAASGVLPGTVMQFIQSSYITDLIKVY